MTACRFSIRVAYAQYLGIAFDRSTAAKAIIARANTILATATRDVLERHQHHVVPFTTWVHFHAATHAGTIDSLQLWLALDAKNKNNINSTELSLVPSVLW